GDAEEGIRLGLELLGDAARRAAMAEAGRTFAQTHRGATGRTMALLATLPGATATPLRG
ncbi:MAG: 3-deoxy-D-manno-octulosonic acid transferase, partial [Zoogloea sp.]|nr:3-deoxy-D-manno-octulosonic acid transferase [Zoogloea sp.]